MEILIINFMGRIVNMKILIISFMANYILIAKVTEILHNRDNKGGILNRLNCYAYYLYV